MEYKAFYCPALSFSESHICRILPSPSLCLCRRLQDEQSCGQSPLQYWHSRHHGGHRNHQHTGCQVCNKREGREEEEERGGVKDWKKEGGRGGGRGMRRSKTIGRGRERRGKEQ